MNLQEGGEYGPPGGALGRLAEVVPCWSVRNTARGPTPNGTARVPGPVKRSVVPGCADRTPTAYAVTSFLGSRIQTLPGASPRAGRFRHELAVQRQLSRVSPRLYP